MDTEEAVRIWFKCEKLCALNTLLEDALREGA